MNGQERQRLRDKRRIVIKIGSSSLTHQETGDLNLFKMEQLVRIIRKHGAGKILFGTDCPWSGQKESIARIEGLPLSEEEKALIFGENAKKLLELE